MDLDWCWEQAVKVQVGITGWLIRWKRCKVLIEPKRVETTIW